MFCDTHQRTIKRPTLGAGFTLIELLVVIVIVGIVSAVAMLSLGLLSDDSELNREARRLSSLIELANDEATLQGRDYGLEFIQSGYRFVEHDPFTEQWIEVVGDDFLRPRVLSEDIEFDLYLEDKRILLKTDTQDIAIEDDEDDDEQPRQIRVQAEEYVPHILIMSSGDVSPFELMMVRRMDRASITITMTLEGELEIEHDDQQSL